MGPLGSFMVVLDGLGVFEVIIGDSLGAPLYPAEQAGTVEFFRRGF